MMKALKKLLCLVVGPFFMAGIAYWTIAYGPLSQQSRIESLSAANLNAIRGAQLHNVDSFPITDLNYQDPWRPIEGFTAPWTPGLFLSHFVSNGPIQGVPYSTPHGIIVNDVTLIMTHRWFNSRSWGLAYNPSHTMIPAPYWSTHITEDWYVWHFQGSGNQPNEAGLWYK
jgi:hypothetical protein